MNLNGLHKISPSLRSISDYEQFNPALIREMRNTASQLKGLRVFHLNATALGGGVAEMLYGEVGLEQSLGINASWFVLPPDPVFFEITKKIHNFLQGEKGNLSMGEQMYYIEYNRVIAQSLLKLYPPPDVLIIHDPQPAAAASFMGAQLPKTVIWRSHIDTSSPNPAVFKFILPFLKFYSHYIFTMPEYVHGDLPSDKISFIAPVIDPLSEKNRLMDIDRAKDHIRQFGIDMDKPLITQVSRLDPWKDPLGVIDAYRLAKKTLPDLQLVLLAQTADDDPEGRVIAGKVKEHIGGEKGIFLLTDVSDNDRTVNAFQTASDIIIQKSIREGFGLTVTEAMWKGAAVIASSAGGIKLQIKDGVSGFLVNSVEEAAEKILFVLKNPGIKKRISQKAHLSVKNNFLLPHLVLKHLKLFKRLLRKESRPIRTPNAFSMT